MLEEAIKNYIKFQDETDHLEYMKKKENFFAPRITDPNKGGFVFCGEDTFDSLSEICDSVMKSEKWKRRVPKNKLMDEILKLFGKLIFDINFPADDTKSFINELISVVSNKLQSYTIYIPCHLSYSNEVKEVLRLGKVTMFNRLAFDDHIYTEKLAEDPYIDILNEGIKHYKNFGWFMSVYVENVYDFDTANTLAESAAKNLLNLLHIIISSSHSNKMIVGIDIATVNRNYTIYAGDKGNIGCSTTSSSSGNVGLPKQLLSLFDHPFPKNLLDVFEECINLSLDLNDDFPITNRILDAAFWYGDAVRESNYSVMIVKYVTALERLLIFGNEGSFKSKIANRGRALLSMQNFIAPQEMEEQKIHLQKMYKLRSEILHGEISPTSVEFEMPIYKMEECCRTIIQAFAITVQAGLKNKNEPDLLKWLKVNVDRIIIKV
jgi:hypothetical protein